MNMGLLTGVAACHWTEVEIYLNWLGMHIAVPVDWVAGWCEMSPWAIKLFMFWAL